MSLSYAYILLIIIVNQDQRCGQEWMGQLDHPHGSLPSCILLKEEGVPEAASVWARAPSAAMTETGSGLCCLPVL